MSAKKKNRSDKRIQPNRNKPKQTSRDREVPDVVGGEHVTRQPADATVGRTHRVVQILCVVVFVGARVERASWKFSIDVCERWLNAKRRVLWFASFVQSTLRTGFERHERDNVADVRM